MLRATFCLFFVWDILRIGEIYEVGEKSSFKNCQMCFEWWAGSSVRRNFIPGRGGIELNSRDFSGPKILILVFFRNCLGFFGIKSFDAFSDLLKRF